DTDCFSWFCRHAIAGGTPAALSLFAPGEKLVAGTVPLSVAPAGGHARLDFCDWNNDGKTDLVVADGSGTLTLFLNEGTRSQPRLAAGEKIHAEGKPIQGSS